MAAGGVGYFATGYFHLGYWELNYWKGAVAVVATYLYQSVRSRVGVGLGIGGVNKSTS